jgi:anti-anti-sigma factor
VDQRIAVKGELDVATAPGLLRRLDESIDARPGAVLEMDFAEVTFIDSTGLGMLIFAHRRACAAGGDMRFTNLQPNVQRVFELTGLDKVLRPVA